MTRTRNWADLSTAEFATLDMARVVALQPVAAIEQHGPHLPVGVDAAINQGIVERALPLVPDDVEVLLLPAQVVGKSNEHLAFPGTLSLSYEVLGKLWLEIGESVRRSGCRRIVFFNSHGGQPQLVDIVCRELRVRLGMFAVACTWFQAIEMADLVGPEELAHGIHGGEIETSMMLHLRPDLVRMNSAQNFVSVSAEIERTNSVLRSEGKTGFGWQMQDLNPFGVAGDAGAATAELGKKLVRRSAERLATLLAETASYPLENLRAGTAFSGAAPDPSGRPDQAAASHRTSPSRLLQQEPEPSRS